MQCCNPVRLQRVAQLLLYTVAPDCECVYGVPPSPVCVVCPCVCCCWGNAWPWVMAVDTTVTGRPLYSTTVLTLAGIGTL